ncbi:hypothetical protein RHGRI_008370 [Rhododendron griersonianum]|uniref:Uncharacterized protein n=1 Tax=Rhododendron griersonianum TaxID=479676 RepID=A0AAV6L043_9ERIC|nr:hypothetical protein RHGRI_008370 [Rhododendron griersonianum]
MLVVLSDRLRGISGLAWVLGEGSRTVILIACFLVGGECQLPGFWSLIIALQFC